MNGRKCWLLILAGGLLFTMGSCTKSILDEGDGADVVLEVQQMTVPPVTATVDATAGTCTFNVTEATATLANVPKSGVAITSPFNDVLIESMTISFAWDDALPQLPHTTGPRTVIPAGGTGQVEFVPIPLAALVGAAVRRDGHSAELTILFTGRTQVNEVVQTVGGATLIVDSCS